MKGVPTDKAGSYLKDMLNKCKRIQPEYLPIVEVVDYQYKKFIVTWASALLYNNFTHPQFLSPNGTKDGTKQATPNRRTERVQLILFAIQEDPQVTVRTLVENLGISKNTILRILKELQENGSIKREGSSRKGRWVIL